MALDSVFLNFLCRELKKSLIGSKIEKVQQPGKNDIILSLKCFDGRKNLYIGGSSGSGRMNLTHIEYENPQEPPMFCMLLRKHLVGARIADIIQPENERIIIMELDAPGMFGEGEKKRLIAELFGRTVNIILTDGEGIITDCLHRVGSIENDRAIQPGMLYRFPKKQDKIDLLKISEEELSEVISFSERDSLVEKWLIRTFYGFSPLTARELSFLAAGDVSAILGAVGKDKIVSELKKYKDLLISEDTAPYLLRDNSGDPVEFSYMHINQYGLMYSCERLQSFSECVELFWGQKNEAELRRQRSNTLMHTVKVTKDRTERRLSSQKNELLLSRDREYLRQCGDIITSNIHLMRKGMRVLRAYDYYSEDGGEREIQLDPLKTPQQNAAKYYKDYSKAKSAEIHLSEQIEKGETELKYLESVIDELTRAETVKDISEIRAELVGAGIVREGKTKGRQKRTISGPMLFRSSGGLTIRVGRNNTQNDALTLKNSSKTDMWFHAQDIHGSHVVVSSAGKELDYETLSEAASLAAYYSQANKSSKVPVAYTLVKHVKKPNGARPGMVIYTDYKTIYAEPSSDLAERLRVK